MAAHPLKLDYADFMYQKWLKGLGLKETERSWNKLHPEEPTTVATIQRFFAAFANGGDGYDLKRGEKTMELPPTSEA